MDPETQALLQYLSTNFGLGAPVPNMNMELPFADEPPSRLAPPTVVAGPPAEPAYRPDMNATFGAAGVPNPAGMPAEVPPAQSVGVPPYSGRTGTSLGELLQSGVKRVGQAAVDYMKPPVAPTGPPPMSGSPVPFPGFGFLTKPVQEPPAVPTTPIGPSTPQQAAVFDQTPQTAQATAAPPAQAGGNKLIDALRGVVPTKPPDVQRPIPHREAQPHKIESTIAMLASLGITPKDLFHIPSLGQSLRG